MLQNLFYAILGTFYTLLNNTDIYLSYFILSYVFLGHNDSVEWGLTVVGCEVDGKKSKNNKHVSLFIRKVRVCYKSWEHDPIGYFLYPCGKFIELSAMLFLTKDQAAKIMSELRIAQLCSLNERTLVTSILFDPSLKWS